MLQTDHFSFQPIDARLPLAALADEHFEVFLKEDLQQGKAGPIYFYEPGHRWETMEEQQILRTHPVEWALARLLYLLRQADREFDLVAAIQHEEKEMRLPLIVRNSSDQLIAILTLTASSKNVTWQGPAQMYLNAKKACDELQSLMFSQPEQLAEYTISVPFRKKMGWNGKRFLGQRVIKRPEFYAKDEVIHRRTRIAHLAEIRPGRVFRVQQFPRDDESEDFHRRPFRYSSSWPPPESWENYPNWKQALDEEGRSGQDESTMKPTRQQSFISDEVDWTSGWAWLPTGEQIPVLIGLSSGTPTGVVCFEEKEIWRFELGEFVGSDLTPQQRQKFPLRVVSRLSLRRKSGNNIRMIVSQDGQMKAIELQEEERSSNDQSLDSSNDPS